MRREFVDITAGVQDNANQFTRDDGLKTVAAMGLTIVRPGGAVTEPRESDNALLMLAGDHVGATLTKARTLLSGSPGARFTRRVIVRADASFEGLHFVSTDTGENTAAGLVQVNATSTARFVGCTFERRSTDTATGWVTVESGGKAHFIGCTFLGTPAVGDCVANAGLAANVGVWASNKTGRPVGANTTAIFVTT